MENSAFVNYYIKELEAEYTSSRKCIERIPESSYDFKPHPSSMELRYLVLLTADIPRWITYMIKEGEVDFATYEQFEWKTPDELTNHFDEAFKEAIESLKSITDEDLKGDFHLKRNGEVLFTQSIFEGIGSTIHHWVHHRGQLTVYMRISEIPVPSIYGPSADDRVF
ncbi:DinB family protein [Dyadobacter sp. CY323]|uniref:DinB family protein n=1 Tax=Dyadobacter sp. CY323 TaxID=2907302 RepID=UPI001F3099A0|nr:DinB family protein [Dyadobacter sp. CY323]MCE6991305.1 DinB family protein [Dyadobacter sp. CY323]